MPAPVITLVENAPYQDGLSLRATLSAAPAGTLRFYGDPQPGFTVGAGTQKTFTSLGGNQYKVAVKAAPQVASNYRIPFYLRASDDNGVGAPNGDFLCAGLNTDWMNQLDQVIQDILVSNRLLLDRGMELELQSQAFPSGRAVRVQEIYRGTPNNSATGRFPRICHMAYSRVEDFLGVPQADYMPFRSRIECYAPYQAEVDWSPVVKALGGAVWTCLNQPYNQELLLDCGLKMYQCYCESGTVQEYYDGAADAVFVTDTLEWQCRMHAGKSYPDQY